MGRRQTSEHLQAVTDLWRRHLLRIGWEKANAAGDARILAGVLGVSDNKADASQRRRWEKATKELRAAMPAAGDGPGRSHVLDEWIGRHLVRPGPDLLIPEETRRAALARVRDAHRRQARVGQDIRSARIEMRAEVWTTLKAIRTTLQAQAARRISLGAALEKIIEAYHETPPPPVARKTPDRTRQRTSQEPDLFARLGPGKPSG